MKSILEQNFNELYAQINERVKCIQPIDQLDTFTKFMMFETLNQILFEVFGGSRFMYLIKITDTSFVVLFLDRYKTQQTTDLVVPFVNSFEIPDTKTLINMSTEELMNFHKRAIKNGLSNIAIARAVDRPIGWYSNLLNRRRRGVDVRRLGNIKRSQQKLTPAHKLGFAMIIELLANDIPTSTSLISKVVGLNINAVRNFITVFPQDKEYYHAVLSDVDRTQTNHVVREYCTLCLKITNGIITCDKTISRSDKSALLNTMHIDGMHWSIVKHKLVYFDEDLILLENLKNKLSQLINNTKGGKEND